MTPPALGSEGRRETRAGQDSPIQRFPLLPSSRQQPTARVQPSAAYQVPLRQKIGSGVEHVLVTVAEELTIPKVAPVGIALESA